MHNENNNSNANSIKKQHNMIFFQIQKYHSPLFLFLVDKEIFVCVKLLIFSFPTVLTYILGAQKNRLIETVLLSTHNICFG